MVYMGIKIIQGFGRQTRRKATYRKAETRMGLRMVVKCQIGGISFRIESCDEFLFLWQ